MVMNIRLIKNIVMGLHIHLIDKMKAKIFDNYSIIIVQWQRRNGKRGRERAFKGEGTKKR